MQGSATGQKPEIHYAWLEAKGVFRNRMDCQRKRPADFPQPLQLSPNFCWTLRDVLAWIEARPRRPSNAAKTGWGRMTQGPPPGQECDPLDAVCSAASSYPLSPKIQLPPRCANFRATAARVNFGGIPPTISAALAKAEVGKAMGKASQAERSSLAWLCINYYQSADFRRLDGRTQRVRPLILDGLSHSGGGPLPSNKVALLSILRWRDAKLDRPEAANALIKARRQLSTLPPQKNHPNL
jgi:hypothetical protein